MLHAQLIQRTGGSEGVRDYNLLDSALETPFQSFGGEELYPTIQSKAARLGYGLIKNHCMIDGNKRIGTHVMFVFLALNGIELSYTQKELYANRRYFYIFENKLFYVVEVNCMQIFVDADECPVVHIIEELAEKYRIED